MKALVLVYIVEKVAHAHVHCAEHTFCVVLVNTWASCRAETVEQDLLVAYLVNIIRASRQWTTPAEVKTRFFEYRTSGPVIFVVYWSSNFFTGPAFVCIYIYNNANKTIF